MVNSFTMRVRDKEYKLHRLKSGQLFPLFGMRHGSGPRSQILGSSETDFQALGSNNQCQIFQINILGAELPEKYGPLPWCLHKSQVLLQNLSHCNFPKIACKFASKLRPDSHLPSAAFNVSRLPSLIPNHSFWRTFVIIIQKRLAWVLDFSPPKTAKYMWKTMGPSSSSGTPNICLEEHRIRCYVFLTNTVLLNRCGFASLKLVFQLPELFGFAGFFKKQVSK